MRATSSLTFLLSYASAVIWSFDREGTQEEDLRRIRNRPLSTGLDLDSSRPLRKKSAFLFEYPEHSDSSSTKHASSEEDSDAQVDIFEEIASSKSEESWLSNRFPRLEERRKSLELILHRPSSSWPSAVYQTSHLGVLIVGAAN